jgi:DUF1707 SHOCT-like domain/Cell wall-active antibiotics response LiaF, C-terminal
MQTRAWSSVAGMDDPSFRVSDAEREHTVISLREHLLAGRLTLEEFSERVEAALRASVSGELARVQQDLPAVSSTVAHSRRKPTRFTVALFGHVVRRGRLRLRGWTFAAAAFGDLDFDLREAAIDQPRTAATVVLAFGNVDVYVPEGVNVDVSGITIFGHLRERGQDIAALNAPTIHVRAVGCFATVDVWRVPHNARGSYSDIFRQVKERERQLPG